MACSIASVFTRYDDPTRRISIRELDMPCQLCSTRSLTRQDGVSRDLEGTDDGQLCTRISGFFAWSCHVHVHV
jgi:hypothetical protein